MGEWTHWAREGRFAALAFAKRQELSRSTAGCHALGIGESKHGLACDGYVLIAWRRERGNRRPSSWERSGKKGKTEGSRRSAAAETSRLVEVGDQVLREIERGRRPNYGFIPGVADCRLVADLDRANDGREGGRGSLGADRGMPDGQ